MGMETSMPRKRRQRSSKMLAAMVAVWLLWMCVVADAKEHREGSCDDDDMEPATCSYYARKRSGCARPRTCADCLKMEGCVISASGKCVQASELSANNETMDFQDAIRRNITAPKPGESIPPRIQFPAGRVSYCAPSDRVCASCVQRFLALDLSGSQFCVGANGCVCIAACEALTWEASAGGIRCGRLQQLRMEAATSPRPPLPPDRDLSTNWGRLSLSTILPGLVVVAIGAMLWRRVRRSSGQPSEAMDPRPASGPSTSGNTNNPEAAPSRAQLTLSGWQSSRQELHEKETLQLFDASHLSPSTLPCAYVDLKNVEPSAPEFIHLNMEPSAPDDSLRPSFDVQASTTRQP
ncbi:hypothetical protein PINS_up008381 [Pythium insidiosum]|nr:hypothetical protein PINS_up008381 [Pythium insidiosum]